MAMHKSTLQLTTALLLANPVTFAADNFNIVPSESSVPRLHSVTTGNPLKTQPASKEDFEKLAKYIFGKRDILFNRLADFLGDKLHFLDMSFCVMPDSLNLPENVLDEFKREIKNELKNYCNDLCYNFQMALPILDYMLQTYIDNEVTLQPFLATYHEFMQTISLNRSRLQEIITLFLAEVNPETEKRLNQKFQEFGLKQHYSKFQHDLGLISRERRTKLSFDDFLARVQKMVDLSHLKIERQAPPPVSIPVTALAPTPTIKKEEPKVKMRPALAFHFGQLQDRSSSEIDQRKALRGEETVMTYGRVVAVQYYHMFTDRINDLLIALNPAKIDLSGIKVIAHDVKVIDLPGMRDFMRVVEDNFDSINQKRTYRSRKPNFTDISVLIEGYKVKQLLDFYHRVSDKLGHNAEVQKNIRDTLVLSLLRHFILDWRQSDLLQNKQTAHDYLLIVANDVMKVHQLFEKTNPELAHKVIFDLFMYLQDQADNCQVGMCGRMYLVQHNIFMALMEFYHMPLPS